MKSIKKILIANRSEIAIRISRAATELGFKTVSIYSYEDRFALHRFKTDESYLVGSGLGPIQAYLDYKGIVQIAINSGCDAIHPGYGFLSENPEFADECAKHNILFVGPDEGPWSRRKKNIHKSNNLFKFDYSNIDKLKKNIGIESERNLQVGTILVAAA